ncbi:calphotin-like [Penaeus japonicus]|uniref:calphotin-like n=1 Tax=Penaeus japonicus TaxID=27405 RepID=UPI001C716F78|nr:calphotin-like [Penaeus japonicus]
MLAIVVLAVVAAVQVECAPNQLWPAAQKPSSFAPTKKPIFGAKEAPAKVDSALANQHAYEQFINTWLQQASLTLNRPELLRFLKPIAPPSVAPTPAPEVVPAIGQSVLSAVTEPVKEVVVALEEVVPLVAAEETPFEASLLADHVVETLNAGSPAEDLPFVQDVVVAGEPEMVPVPVELSPVPVESEVSPATTSELEVIPVDAEPEVVPVAAEPDVLAVAAEPEVLAVAAEPETQDVPVEAELNPVAVEPEQLFPVAAEAEVEPVGAGEAIPSLVELDASTVLLSTEAPIPLFPLDPEPAVEEAINEPVPTAKSFSSVSRTIEVAPIEEQTPVFPQGPVVPEAPVVQHARPVTNPTFPGAVFFPSVIKPVRVAPLPASSGAVTTQGLTYTLQFFPTQDRSHFFVSTKLGS